MTFWIKASIAVASGVLALKLCSDTGGVTAVNSLTLNRALVANAWTAVTLNNGAALGSSIQSIALYAISDPGTVNIWIDSVNACGAPTAASCLTLNTLISSDQTNFWPIQSINGTTVKIDGSAETDPGAGTTVRGYTGSITGSSELYLLQAIQLQQASTAALKLNTAVSGTSSNLVTIIGGWDTTAMTTRSGYTVVDGGDNQATYSGLYSGASAQNYVSWNYMGTVRYATAASYWAFTTFANCIATGCDAYPTFTATTTSQGNLTITSCSFTSMGNSASNFSLSLPVPANSGTTINAPPVVSISSSNFLSNGGPGILLTPASSGVAIGSCTFNNNLYAGVNAQTGACYLNNITTNYNAKQGFQIDTATDVVCQGLTAQNNTVSNIDVLNGTGQIYSPTTAGTVGVNFSGNGGNLVVYNWTTTDTTKYNFNNAAQNSYIASQDEGGNIQTGNLIYSPQGVTNSTDGSGGTSYQGNPVTGWVVGPALKSSPTHDTPTGTNTTATASSAAPMRLKVASIACPSGQTTTVTYWAKLLQAVSSATISAQLRVFGGRYPGVGSAGSDVTTPITASSWTQYAIQFSPTANCVVDIFLEAWISGTSSGSTLNTASYVNLSGPVTVVQ